MAPTPKTVVPSSNRPVPVTSPHDPLTLDFSVGSCIAAGKAAAPYALHGAVSGAAWGATLLLFQTTAAAARLSCAMPIISPTLGMIGVCAASAASNQASRRLDYYLATGSSPLSMPLVKEHLVYDAILGAAFFRSLGGRFSAALPSDVRFPGAKASASIPAKGEKYATPAERVELQTLLRKGGCHHCGTRRGEVIGDHMPPNKSAHGGTTGNYGPVNWGNPEEVRAMLARVMGSLPLVGSMVPAYQPPAQRLYPQCEPCSGRQSQIMRTGKSARAIVMHFGGLERSDLAGIVPGPLRYLMLGGSGPNGPWGWKDLDRCLWDARLKGEEATVAGAKKLRGWGIPVPKLPFEVGEEGRKQLARGGTRR